MCKINYPEFYINGSFGVLGTICKLFLFIVIGYENIAFEALTLVITDYKDRNHQDKILKQSPLQMQFNVFPNTSVTLGMK